MAKKIKAFVKLVLSGGKATAGPPVGPALGQHGINIALFCKEYNAQTCEHVGVKIPAKVIIYEDKSFFIILKSPPAAFLLLQAIGAKKGSANSKKEKMGTLSTGTLAEIAKIKLGDFNTENLDLAISMLKGTAKNMGILVE